MFRLCLFSPPLPVDLKLLPQEQQQLKLFQKNFITMSQRLYKKKSSPSAPSWWFIYFFTNILQYSSNLILSLFGTVIFSSTWPRPPSSTHQKLEDSLADAPDMTPVAPSGSRQRLQQRQIWYYKLPFPPTQLLLLRNPTRELKSYLVIFTFAKQPFTGTKFPEPERICWQQGRLFPCDVVLCMNESLMC